MQFSVCMSIYRRLIRTSDAQVPADLGWAPSLTRQLLDPLPRNRIGGDPVYANLNVAHLGHSVRAGRSVDLVMPLFRRSYQLIVDGERFNSPAMAPDRVSARMASRRVSPVPLQIGIGTRSVRQPGPRQSGCTGAPASPGVTSTPPVPPHASGLTADPTHPADFRVIQTSPS